MNDGSSPFDRNDTAPFSGCFSVCATCGGLGIFNDDLTLRKPTQAEIDAIPNHQKKDLEHMQAAITSLGKIKKGFMAEPSEDDDNDVKEAITEGQDEFLALISADFTKLVIRYELTRIMTMLTQKSHDTPAAHVLLDLTQELLPMIHKWKRTIEEFQAKQ